MKFSINKNVFEKFPNIVEYVAIFSDFNNEPEDSVKAEIVSLLRATEEEVRVEIQESELLDHVNVKPYLEYFQSFGMNPKKVKPSHLALLSRVVKGGNLPDINPYSNLYNALSLKHKLPFGGEDLDTVYGDSQLVVADGGEHWLGIGEDASKFAVKGEILWQDYFDVTCKSWNWRQCDRTKVTENTKNSYLIVDCIKSVTEQVGKTAIEDFAKLVVKYLGGKFEIYKLDSVNNEVEIDYASKSIAGVEKPKQIQINKEASKEKSKAIQAQKSSETVFNYNEGTIEDRIQSALLEALYINNIDLAKNQISVEKSIDASKGDYTSTVVLRVAKKYSKNPIELSKLVVASVSPIDSVKKVEAVAPGFINFFVEDSVSSNILQEILEQKDSFGSSKSLNQQIWLIEHTSPNPNKAMHLGHLRNNITGMAVANIVEATGVNVIRDCIDNNRGIAIAKLMWGFLKFGRRNGDQEKSIEYWIDNKNEWLTPDELGLTPDKFMDQYYVKGSEDFKSDSEIEKKVRDIVVRWEAKDTVVWELWKHVLDYSYKGQALILKRIGNKWDKVWHEHEHYQKGKDFVTLGLRKGIFKNDDGAVITQLEKYKIPNTVVTKSDGTALYITQDLALTKLKKDTFHPDKIIWVIGPEQALALKQMFAVCEQLGIGKVDEFLHLPYGYMSIKGQGKMSSRTGNVLYIEDLLDEAKTRILKHYEKFPNDKLSQKEKEEIAEKVGVGSVKYSILKVGRLTDIAFDFDTSFSFDGDSAPYIMYTYVRICSILRQAEMTLEEVEKRYQEIISKYQPNELELELVKKLADFPSIVMKSKEQFAPNYLCLYLYQLAQQFSEFYNKLSILKADTQNEKDYRLMLCACCGIVIKNGFRLLGVETVEKM